MPRSEWFRPFFDRTYVDILIDQKPAEQTDREVEFIAGALGLAPGARVLDVPCGYGRHASRLARRGFEVVGVDLSPAMIAEGRRRFGRRARLRLERGDMRRLRWRGEFDAVVNLFTSFGYFNDRENRAVVRGFARVLRPGGRLLIDHRDPAHDARALKGQRWYRAGERFILEASSMDAERGIQTLDWQVITLGERRIRRKTAVLRQYRIGEWREMFRAAGLRLVRAWSGYDGTPHRPGRGPRLIVLGEKPSGSGSSGRRTLST